MTLAAHSNQPFAGNDAKSVFLEQIVYQHPTASDYDRSFQLDMIPAWDVDRVMQTFSELKRTSNYLTRTRMGTAGTAPMASPRRFHSKLIYASSRGVA